MRIFWKYLSHSYYKKSLSMGIVMCKLSFIYTYCNLNPDRFSNSSSNKYMSLPPSLVHSWAQRIFCPTRSIKTNLESPTRGKASTRACGRLRITLESSSQAIRSVGFYFVYYSERGQWKKT